MIYDVLIFGGGVSGVSCALILGSAQKKEFVADKKIGIIAHQKGSMLQDALFNNAYGITPGTLGSELLETSLENLASTYPQINQILNEKVVSIEKQKDLFLVTTNKNNYQTKIIVVATNSSNAFNIEGLMEYVIPHQKSIASKNRIQLMNIDHKVTDNIYVAGTLAGWRSQLSIAAGSGAAVATDILVEWNNGNETHAHDSIKK
ncbi:NAD(P)/FAD-dependent oxidoreductase [Paenimyroides tangerinum]|uniref:NAD(P)/FAD-dependent oxidoreductase n=2 Tax=Paenimyroides tangerinum TaxID=2488728 RepID=A0A3P3WF08_9FLAO|nr:NAD(P)/FAD-dependent oxidoreductase [Paenimyroides tangerinum]